MKATVFRNSFSYKGKKYTYKELSALRNQKKQEFIDIDKKLKEIDSSVGTKSKCLVT